MKLLLLWILFRQHMGSIRAFPFQVIWVIIEDTCLCYRDRVFQEIGEPGPGSLAVGYVRYSSELQNETSIVTQKRLIQEFLDKKGWKLARWYEEPEQSAKYDSIDDRPIFAQLLNEAGTRFQVVVCAFSNRWARSMEAGYASLSRLRRARV